MILLQPPFPMTVRTRPQKLPAIRTVETPLTSIPQGRFHPQCSVPSFRSFALHSHIHADDITAQEAVSLMLAFYRDVRAPEGLLEKDGDVLQLEWGTYDCGETELFHFELSRHFTEAGSDEENRESKFTIGLHYRPTFTLRALQGGEHWCWSHADVDAFRDDIRASEVYRAVSTLPPAEVALEWNRV
jgi:hypothetical protein